MLPRWFRVLLVVDVGLVAVVAVLGARLALDGGRAVGRELPWARPGPAAIAPPLPGDVPVATAPPAAPGAPATGPALGPALLHRLDSDTAASANAQRGLLGLLEEAIRRRVVDLLEQVSRGG